jgi:hypothetical protein
VFLTLPVGSDRGGETCSRGGEAGQYSARGESAEEFGVEDGTGTAQEPSSGEGLLSSSTSNGRSWSRVVFVMAAARQGGAIMKQRFGGCDVRWYEVAAQRLSSRPDGGYVRSLA